MEYNSFLLQTTVVLHDNEYSEYELNMIYNFITLVDDDILVDYKHSNTIPDYKNDLELFIDIVDKLIKIFERTEEYDKCLLLKNKKEESMKIF
jgi:hypothetical protein